MSCAQGSPGSERAHRPCSPASVRTCPAGIPVRGCVDVRAHTREAREPRAYHSCTPLPPALPSSSSSLSVSDSWQKICPQLSNRPHKLCPCFQVPTDSRGLWGAHEQYLSNPWAPLHADLCMWKPERSGPLLPQGMEVETLCRTRVVVCRLLMPVGHYWERLQAPLALYVTLYFIACSAQAVLTPRTVVSELD
jgi:hypothetical protein